MKAQRGSALGLGPLTPAFVPYHPEGWNRETDWRTPAAITVSGSILSYLAHSNHLVTSPVSTCFLFPGLSFPMCSQFLASQEVPSYDLSTAWNRKACKTAWGRGRMPLVSPSSHFALL
jgi:hypothetical protein